MKNLWVQLQKNNKGFSLVEAIVSVVILGIAIIPISTVFTMTVTRTVDTRKQLEANEIAQHYMESIKNKDFNEFGLILSDVQPSYTIDASTSEFDLDARGLEKVSDNYRVVLSFESGVEGSYGLPANNAPLPVDTIVTIPSGYDERVVVQNGDTTNQKIYPNPAGTSTNKRTILITAERGSSDFKISYLDDATTKGDDYNVSRSTNAIRFVMGNGTAGALYDTNIVVRSEIMDEVKIYVYESEDNTVDAAVAIESGLVSVSRNLYTADVDQYRIVEFKVDVIDVLTNKTLTSITSTKINE